ncbi:MAG: hypothetical protein CSA54_04630 [Gammaproteobacteria bacterium]|nr:MAG: hypothetical protein CSA54_04630 [Gammaproteobacteria bacterium]
MADYAYPAARIAIFAKAPVPGQVKTRLQPALTAAQSACLQERLLAHSINTALASQLAPVQLWCAPDTRHSAFQHYREHVQLLPQCGGDLGQRMQYAFADNACPTVLIGTDCPALQARHLHRALQAIEQHAVCLIPAEDGGYVLIASATQPRCFAHINWGSEQVLAQTLAALRQHRQSVQQLPALADLDTAADLRKLPEIWIKKLRIEMLHQQLGEC